MGEFIPQAMNEAPATHTPAALKEQLRAEAMRLGFDAFGITTPNPVAHADHYRHWTTDGQHGGMEWMARDIDRRLSPALVLPGVRSLICLGMNYHQARPIRRGTVASYALGGDYHKLISSRLKQFCETLRSYGGDNRPYVDTGPLLEKPLAARAGLGWQGKHTNLVHEKLGGWLFLGTILSTLDLPPDAPAKDRCGSCTRCIDACPTGAITAPYQLDARRCISYLTIEHRGPIAEPLRPLIGDHLYGCDDCVGICPWNRWAQASREERFTPRPLPDPVEILRWNKEDFDRELAGRAMRRTKLEGMRRNVCIVLGNIGTLADIPPLQTAARDEDAVVAEHATWAIGRIKTRIKQAEQEKPQDFLSADEKG